MKVFVLFEKLNIEIYGKIVLGNYLTHKYKFIEEVKIGFYRELFFEILNLDNKDDVLIILKDIYKPNQVLIDLFNLRGFKYIFYHEEEHYLQQIQIKEGFFNQMLSKKYFKKLKNYLALSNNTKKDFINHYEIEEKKIISAGNPKYDYLKILNNHKDYCDKAIVENDFVLIALPESFFISFKYYFYGKKNFKNIKNPKTFFLGHNNAYEAYTSYKHLKRSLKLYRKIIKENPNQFFVLRPHPSDTPWINKFNRMFKNFKNLSIKLSDSSYPWIIKSKFVLTSPQSIVIDSFIIKKKCLIYYDRDDLEDQYLFNKHPSVKLGDELFFSNIKEYSKIFASKSMEKINFQLIEDYTNINKNFYQIIDDIVKKEILIKKKNSFINNFIFNFLFRRVINEITKFKNINSYGNEPYLKFKKKFKFSLERFLVFIYFYKNDLKLDFLNIIFKYCLGRSPTNVESKKVHGGESELIDEIELKYFLKYFKEKIPFFNNSFSLSKNRKSLIIKKI